MRFHRHVLRTLAQSDESSRLCSFLQFFPFFLLKISDAGQPHWSTCIISPRQLDPPPPASHCMSLQAYAFAFPPDLQPPFTSYMDEEVNYQILHFSVTLHSCSINNRLSCSGSASHLLLLSVACSPIAWQPVPACICTGTTTRVCLRHHRHDNPCLPASPPARQPVSA